MLNTPLKNKLKDESGQAIFLLLMVAISMLFFISLMYHTGALIVLKMKVQNTADMAAMSAATVQARGMQAIIQRNKRIVDVIRDANSTMWSSGMTFPTDADAEAFIDTNYDPLIDDYVTQIRAIQTSVKGNAIAVANEVAQRNLTGAVATWHTPNLNEPGVGAVFMRLQNRANSTIHYALPDSPFDKHRTTSRNSYFRGKTNHVVYSAVEVRLNNVNLGGFVTSNINSLVAYAAAKPWGGKITGVTLPEPFFRGLRIHTVDLPTWSQILNVSLHDPEDYDVWLVSIGSSSLNPPPSSIPNHGQYRH